MAARKAYLLRLDPEVLDALQKWAADELRSLNAQIDFLLRQSLRDASRLKPKDGGSRKGGARPERPS